MTWFEGAKEAHVSLGDRQHLENIFFEVIYFGAKVVEVFEMIRSRSQPIFRDYISKLNQKRGQEKSPIHARTLKSLSNCLTGLID